MKLLVIVAIAIAFFVAAVGTNGCGEGPSGDLELRWANAACESHEGIETLNHYDGEGTPPSVICRDGAGFSQRYNGEDAEHEWESPIEVRERSE